MFITTTNHSRPKHRRSKTKGQCDTRILRVIHGRDARATSMSQHLFQAGALILFLSSVAFTQQLTREQWGAPEVRVSETNGKWTIAGKKNVITLNETDLAMKVQAAETVWQMVPSAANDLLVRSKGVDSSLRLADATKKTFTRYDTGFKSGVKIVLYGWKSIDLTLVLTVVLEGREEELVFGLSTMARP